MNASSASACVSAFKDAWRRPSSRSARRGHPETQPETAGKVVSGDVAGSHLVCERKDTHRYKLATRGNNPSPGWLKQVPATHLTNLSGYVRNRQFFGYSLFVVGTARPNKVAWVSCLRRETHEKHFWAGQKAAVERAADTAWAELE